MAVRAALMLAISSRVGAFHCYFAINLTNKHRHDTVRGYSARYVAGRCPLPKEMWRMERVQTTALLFGARRKEGSLLYPLCRNRRRRRLGIFSAALPYMC